MNLPITVLVPVGMAVLGVITTLAITLLNKSSDLAENKHAKKLAEEETEKLKKFRHALPETINQRVGERAATCPG
jgi:hypothetical protein